MGVKISRKKPRNILITLIYKFSKVPFLDNKNKLKLFLNLEWIFYRLSHEYSFRYYDPASHPIRNSKEFILENIKDTDTVLDLGCNVGDISYQVSAKAGSVVGIDYDKKFIETAQERYQQVSNLKFYCSEAYDFLQKSKQQFDTLLLSHILEHLDDPKDFLLKFKGHFTNIYIEVPDFDKDFLNQYRKDLKLPFIFTDSDHISEFDRKEISVLLKECNISVVKSEYKHGVQKYWCLV